MRAARASAAAFSFFSVSERQKCRDPDNAEDYRGYNVSPHKTFTPNPRFSFILSNARSPVNASMAKAKGVRRTVPLTLGGPPDTLPDTFHFFVEHVVGAW